MSLLKEITQGFTINFYKITVESCTRGLYTVFYETFVILNIAFIRNVLGTVVGRFKSLTQ